MQAIGKIKYTRHTQSQSTQPTSMALQNARLTEHYHLTSAAIDKCTFRRILSGASREVMVQEWKDAAKLQIHLRATVVGSLRFRFCLSSLKVLPRKWMGLLEKAKQQATKPLSKTEKQLNGKEMFGESQMFTEERFRRSGARDICLSRSFELQRPPGYRKRMICTIRKA